MGQNSFRMIETNGVTLRVVVEGDGTKEVNAAAGLLARAPYVGSELRGSS